MIKKKKYENLYKETSDLAAKYEQALKQIENFENRVNTAKTAFDNLELPVFFSDVVKIKIDKSKLELKAAESIQEKTKLFASLEEVPALRKNLDKELADLTEKLNQPQKEYQEYERKLAEWHAKESEIIGDESKIDSLKYFENLIDSLIGLPIQLKILKEDRRKKSIEIFNKIVELRDIYRTLYKAVQDFIENDELANKFDLEFDVSIIERSFAEKFLSFIKQNVGGKLYHSGSKGLIDELIEKFNFNEAGDVTAFLNEIENLLEGENVEDIIKGQVTDLYNYIFSLDYLKPTYQLKLFGKGIEQLSPGERGHLLLVFYLLVDIDDRPLIIDQPEGNLDGQSIYETLVLAIKRAKKDRQIIIVTHNPNLAVVCDSEQFIHAFIDRKDGHAVKYSSGALEESDVKKVVIDKLEGTPPAFDNRKSKYSFGVQN